MSEQRTASTTRPTQPAQQTQSRNNYNNNGRMRNIVLFLAVGLMIGIAIALMSNNPFKREKSRREKIGNAIGDTLDSGRDATSDALHRLEDEYRSLRKEVDRLVTRVMG